MANHVVALCLLVFLCGVAVNGNTQSFVQHRPVEAVASNGQPIPKPRIFKSTDVAVGVDPDLFEFRAVGQNCNLIQEAFRRYEHLIFGRINKRNHSLKFKPWKLLQKKISASPYYLSVNFTAPCGPDSTGKPQYPSLESDESYNITVDKNGSVLSANSVWGAIRGLETFSQLFYEGESDTFTINTCYIVDYPRFRHRGLLLDSSRHYISVKVLKENLDAMAQSKFNVFHWHIVDDQSFPYESRSFPSMSEKGSYYGLSHVYSQEEIMDVIEYARLRGIRVVPEFDSPGHTQSWGKGIDNLLTKCYSKGQFNGNYGPIDPSVNSTFDFLASFFKEVSEVFPDHYVHLGGDEVSFDCWKSNPEITQFMKDMGFGTNYAKLEEYYMQRLINTVNSFKKGYLIWQEVIDNGAKVSPDTVVEVWKGSYNDEMNKVTNMGYKTILSSCWYLNYIAYGSDWTKYYLCDPWGFPGTQKQLDLVIGGEVCMWGEYVDNTNLISRTWPRAVAVGERLWSDRTVNDVNDAASRIMEHRCRMIKRGLPAEPFNGPDFCPYEYEQ